MQPRMKQPAAVFPQAMQAMLALGNSTKESGLSDRFFELIHLRASQINGCAFCADMHSKALKRGGETDERLYTVATWHDAPYFTDAERAALALTEAATRLADKSDPVSMAVGMQPPSTAAATTQRRCRWAIIVG
jgi:AhpD family alkylhydroperoxidase